VHGSEFGCDLGRRRFDLVAFQTAAEIARAGIRVNTMLLGSVVEVRPEVRLTTEWAHASVGVDDRGVWVRRCVIDGSGIRP
jgi:hypothetical protein